MVRSYVLTPKEQEIAKAFLADGTKVKGFRMLKKRIKEFGASQFIDFNNQLTLIMKFKSKIAQEG